MVSVIPTSRPARGLVAHAADCGAVAVDFDNALHRELHEYSLPFQRLRSIETMSSTPSARDSKGFPIAHSASSAHTTSENHRSPRGCRNRRRRAVASRIAASSSKRVREASVFDAFLSFGGCGQWFSSARILALPGVALPSDVSRSGASCGRTPATTTNQCPVADVPSIGGPHDCCRSRQANRRKRVARTEASANAVQLGEVVLGKGKRQAGHVVAQVRDG